MHTFLPLFVMIKKIQEDRNANVQNCTRTECTNMQDITLTLKHIGIQKHRNAVEIATNNKHHRKTQDAYTTKQKSCYRTKNFAAVMFTKTQKNTKMQTRTEKHFKTHKDTEMHKQV